MKAQQEYQWLYRYRRPLRLLAAASLVTSALGIYLLVYMTGGIKFVYSHSMYVPILLSGFLFGMAGGALFGLFAGLVLGPFMPIDVVTGEMQETVNWLYRTGFFVLIGSLSGLASHLTRSYVERLQWVSEHDQTTQLPNRNALLKQIAKLDGDSAGHWLLAVIYLENERELNASFGETVVNQVLAQFPTRVVGALRREFPVYRISSAQMAVLIEEGDRDRADLLNALVEAFHAPFPIDGIFIHIDVRIGYTVIGHHHGQPAACLQEAEEAMSAAVESVQDWVAYSPEFIKAKQDNLTIIGDLRNALHTGQLCMYYQPKVEMATGRVVSVEALIRWDHPQRGRIPPDSFIPRAEQSTLINLVTEFALDQAMGQLAAWQQAGIDIAMAINISTRNLLQPDFDEVVIGHLLRYQLEGSKIELEVTEGALAIDMAHTIHELAALSELKVIISVDDFGTGYSSLRYLHLLPISIIKIDQSFVRALPADKGSVHIVEAALMLAHKMGMEVIAEGVDSKAAWDYLRDAGCDMVQGYLVSPPMPAAEFEQWYCQRQGRFDPETVADA
ncbi:MAG: bifunctional diguanylate cyclase/phosphodiesterase [Methylophilaceae bacterium]|jgi:predicted signal transduction protein with EAL and GGDEF domain|nr:bifunctional diguanylate cyclase/phosphodiesterase [Methylophilaceae bacterium]